MINAKDFITNDDITRFLFSQKDEQYRDFSANLIKTVSKSKIIGVRIPVIRKLAKAIHSTDMAQDFLKSLPHEYLEENHLHAFLIEQEKDFEKALRLTDEFLPYVDNWSTCDSFRPKVFKKNLDTLYENILIWIKCNHEYTKRFAIGLLHSFYLDDAFKEEHLLLVSGIKSDLYYINMMIAWYFATALAKQEASTLPYIQNKALDKWTHNKAIQKACESYRVDYKTKSYLKSLRIK